MGFSETVESLKNQYTDKYVKVDAARPELARFRGAVGQVKTVNMNGRALVEFLDYHLNIGWFDIDLSCLTVVDKPEPKAAAEKHAEPKAAAKPAAAKPAAPAAGEKKLSPLELARMQGAGGAKPAGGEAAPAKKSTADILAAARGGAAAPAAKPASGEVKPAGGKPSTADILAAARGGKPAAAAPAAPASAPPQAEAPAAPKLAPAPAAAEPASAGGIVRVDKSSMTVQQMLDYCRAKDAK